MLVNCKHAFAKSLIGWWVTDNHIFFANEEGYHLRSNPNGIGKIFLLLHEYIVTDLLMPSVMSVCSRRHATHMFAGFWVISIPHMQHRIVGSWLSSTTNIDDIAEEDRWAERLYYGHNTAVCRQPITKGSSDTGLFGWKKPTGLPSTAQQPFCASIL